MLACTAEDLTVGEAGMFCFATEKRHFFVDTRYSEVYDAAHSNELSKPPAHP